MSNLAKGALVVVIGIIGFTLAGVGAFMNFYNTEIKLRSQYEAKTDGNKADFDNVWKTIKQTVGVADKYKSDFQDVFVSVINEQTENEENLLAKFVTQANIPFDSAIYAKIQTVVEAQRAGWTTRQKELRDIKRTHDVLLRTLPGSLFNLILGRKELDVVLITSTRTDESFTTGIDDDTSL